MTLRHENSTVTWDELPAAVTTCLRALRDRDAATALTTFAADAEVTDEGRTVRGRSAIADWLSSAGSEFTYTTTCISATMPDASNVDVLQRLDGDFPGGVAELHHRFTLVGGLIRRLVIEP
ncbi:nuclear transport factor 2 family protein [Mycolicibacterium confluentis]|uniref:Uncharacterized protein n=1 Tax=Mycolicibacterium confluentis TaxID=28047 RepID=A0A7I7Y3X9_9MYCO|nr:nuclear transport factor 2 family protein [Mycolicibacterium confluentis]MCV7322752.1 nuclear transport factor 2 family protein [Mycolicibacterium confluentis]ORV29724.1 DUF4440 domain-containing protein [Mycolicibacterium confluentis]BBZ36346.1 hypothetical protein MCNF_49510 [Mycolicibacterium confluentis]